MEVCGEKLCTEEPGLIKCDDCDNRFKTRQGLSMHRMLAHQNPSSFAPDKKFFGPNKVDDDVPKDVQIVLEKVLKGVEGDVLEIEPVLKVGRRGANVRRKYDFIFKMKIIDLIDQGIPQRDIALQNDRDESLVSRWKGQRETIIDGAASKHRKLFTKNRKGSKHNQLFTQLHSKMVDSRSKGMKVSSAWLYIHANKISKSISGSRIPKSAITSFLHKYKIKLRRVQRKKQVQKSNYAPGLMKWHCTLREGLIKTGSDRPNFDPKWGRFPPLTRFNVD